MPHLNFHFFGPGNSFFGPNASGFQRDFLLDPTQGRFVRFSGQHLVPELLETWQSLADGAVWKLKLQTGLRFSNGRSVNARDVEFSLIAPLLSKFSTPEFASARLIYGADRISPGQPYTPNMVSGIQVLSDLEIQIKFAQPNRDFVADLALNPSFSIFPREELHPPGADLKGPSKSSGSYLSWINHPIGAGSFKIVQVNQSGTEIYLKRTNAPSPLHVNSLRLTTGPQIPNDVDLLDRGNASVEIPNQLVKKILPVPAAIYGVSFNFNKEIVRNLTFRRAIQYALDPNQFVEFFPDAKPTSSIIPSHWESWKFESSFQGLDQAKILFEQLKDELRCLPISISSLGQGNSAEPSWVRYVREQLLKAGLPLVETKEKEGEIVLIGFGPSVASPHFLFSLFAEGSGWVSCLNERDFVYNETLNKLGKAKLSDHADLTQALNERWVNQAYAVPLVETPMTLWINSKKKIDLGLQDLCFSFDPIIIF